MKKLPVPYISQWDSDADFSRDDCVPTCAAMMVSYYGGNITPNQLATLTGQGLVDFTEIQTALKKFNYNIVGTSFRTIEDLKKSIDSGIPVLCIIHYGDLPTRQDTGYSGGHAVVAIGYDDDNIYVNDPDFWSPRRNEGASKAYPTAAFNKAWQSKADGNNPSNMWYLDTKVPVTGIDLNQDIPTEVEDAYELKTFDWYDKHWTFADFIKDAVDTHKDLEESDEELKNLKKDVELMKVAMENDTKKFKDMTVQIETLQASNAENTSQLTIMGEQVKEANRQKGIAEAAKLLVDANLKTTTESRDSYKKETERLNAQLVKNLQGYTGWARFKSLFGFYN